MPMPATHPGRARPARLPRTHHHDGHLDAEDGRVKSQFAKAVATFRSLELASLVVNQSSAEEQWTLDALMDQVEDPATLSAARLLVNETALITTTIVGQSLPPQFDARALLAALITATFPSMVAPESSEPGHGAAPHQEAADLANSARCLVAALASLLSCRDQPSRQILAPFARASTTYVSALTEWKTARTQHLVADLVAHAREANLLWITARPRLVALGGQPAREYLDGLRTRAQLIHNRLVRVLRTKGAAEAVLAQARREDGIDFDLARDDVEDLLGGMLSARDSVWADDNVDAEPREMTDNDDSATRPISARNLQFAHDLHLGPVPETASDVALRDRVRSTLRTAFRVHATEPSAPSNRTPPYLIDVLATACDHIAAATPHPESTRAQLDAVINLASPHADVLDAARAVVHAIRTVCAPARDTDVDCVATLIEADLAAGVFAAADLAESVRTDFAQCAAAALRPRVARHVVTWERAAFERAVDDGLVPLELPRTRAWLRAAADGASPASGTASFVTVWNAAFADLLVTGTNPSHLPETFPFDTARIAHLADRAHRLAVAAAVATHARARSKAVDARATATRFLANNTDSNLLDVSRETVARCVARSDPVYRVVARRVRESLLAGLVAGGQGARVARGLECVESEARQWVESAVVLAAHNKRVYAPWYDRILGEVLKV
ncbi:hypothetical protein GGF32_001641 [Allomyces javanicus]|nr:hypothetical protein GGF32_001641 [Allomyces javanicus]